MHTAEDTKKLDRRRNDTQSDAHNDPHPTPGPVESRGSRRAGPRAEHMRSGWAVGRWVSSRYFLERRLGGGATGEVFLAYDRLLKKHVALKVLRRQLAENRETVRRFLREVALAHSVTHPNVVRIYDTGQAHALPYLSMEYLQGQTLQELCGETEAPMTLREIRDICVDILSGLAAAHNVGIVHRDLKPANVVLTHRGAIVTDFGVAGFANTKAAIVDPGDSRSLVRTEVGTIFGSPAYMAPELWDGSPATVQTDLYSFGVMMYQMLTGDLPYNASNARQLVYKLRTSKPAPVRQLRGETPWNVALLVARCMSISAERRPTSATAAARLLAPFAPLRRRRVAVGITLVGAATLALGAITHDGSGWKRKGLPDAVAQADLDAAVREYDVGDFASAYRHLDRLDAAAPRSAALAWWRATIQHSVGDEPTRSASCGEGPWDGSSAWQDLAASACGPTYALAPALQGTLKDSFGSMEEAFLPFAVQSSLVPRMEVARDPRHTAAAEGKRIRARMLAQPDWTSRPVLRVRWQLARFELALASGELVEANDLLEHLSEQYPRTPAVLARGAWLDTHLGRLERARARADTVRDVDPRPWVRLHLEDGQLAAAWYEISDATEPYRHQLLSMWCGYAYRFEVAEFPRQCEELGPGLIRALWGRSTNEDAGAMRPIERNIVTQQRSLNVGECFVDESHRAVLRLAAAPFETYDTQLQAGAAFCLHDTGRADPDLARRLVDELRELTPSDPWVLLLHALADDVAGASRLAQETRKQVAARWQHADENLPLVARVRDKLARATRQPSADDGTGRAFGESTNPVTAGEGVVEPGYPSAHPASPGRPGGIDLLDTPAPIPPREPAGSVDPDTP